jgi:NADPH2:quinone reductase
MKAVWFESKGPARNVLVHGDMPTPEAGVGEVRVRLQVSGVNPTDTKTRGGWLGMTAMPFPRMITGQDGAGIIDQVGPGVAPSRVGERVWVYEAYLGRAFGTLAEYVVVPARNAVRLPDGIDVDTGAGLGVPALTAHRCLFMDGPIQGRTVLVQGGGGGVGHAAIQLASWAGARVIATVSRDSQAAAATSAGASLAVNRKSQNVVEAVRAATGGRGVDRIVEVAFDENIQADAEMLAVGGVIATYSSGPVPQVPIPFFGLMRASQTVHFVLVYTMGDHAHDVAVRDVTACLEAGRYKTHVGARFPLARAAEAHEAQDSGAVVGKILVDLPS